LGSAVKTGIENSLVLTRQDVTNRTKLTDVNLERNHFACIMRRCLFPFLLHKEESNDLVYLNTLSMT
jgi:hypothetical protein